MNVMQVDSGALFALDNAEFLKHAYLRLLGRAPDAEGMQGYLEQLQVGRSKQEIYEMIAASEEARNYEAKRQMLRRAVAPPRHAALALAPSTGHGNHFAPALVPEFAPVPDVDNVAELLDLDGYVFVKAAYKALLGREADDLGLQNYMRLLRDGWSKMHIIKGLATSDEARAHKRELPGLYGALKRYAKAQRRSWGGWYYRSVLGVESDLPMERHLRAANAALRRG